MEFFNKMRGKLNEFNPQTHAWVDKREHEQTKATLDATLRSFVNIDQRPSMPNPFLDTPTGSKVPIWRLHPQRMFDMAENIGDIRVVLETIQREMFKNDIIVRPKFKYQCKDCLKTFKEKPLKTYVPIDEIADGKEELRCDECGNEESKRFKKPVPKGRVTLQTLVDEYVNNNEQFLVSVARQFERDLDTVDSAYTVITRNYKIKVLKTPDPETGAIREAVIDNSDIVEFLRIHPIQVTMIANDDGTLGMGADDRPRWICPNYAHREKQLSKPVCEICGCKAFTAIAETNAVPYGTLVTDPKKQYYARHELIWASGKYMPDILYGNSLLNAIWKKIMSVYHQDEYLWKYFDKDRPPKSILAMGSRNSESVEAFWDRQKQGARADPYMPRPILLNTENVGQALQFIDLTPNFKELELTSVRQELRQMISAIYGIQPVFYGEQTKGGIGNESIQMTITNKTIKGYQNFLNKHFFGKICRVMGVTDWEIVLVASEEIDELREQQIKGEKIKNAAQMYGMGFDVHTNGNGEFIFSQHPNPERQMMMGGVGSNTKQGNLDKMEKPGSKGEKQSNFGGEPIQNRPSDKGGASGGSPSSGFSLSKK